MEFYRYEMRQYSSMHDEGVELLPNVKVELTTLNLHKETPKGYWVGYGKRVPKNLRSDSIWVSKTSKKRYAYPTKEEAMVNFVKRTERRIEILKAHLRACNRVMSIVIKEQKQ